MVRSWSFSMERGRGGEIYLDMQAAPLVAAAVAGHMCEKQSS